LNRERRTFPARHTLAALILACVGGCGTQPFQPKPLDEALLRGRAVTQESRGIRVTAAVPSAAETRALFASRLYSRGVQPVWIEIENRRGVMVSFLPVGLDPEYYTPIETSFVNPAAVDEERGQSVARHFFDRGMGLVIGPGETESGFVFTPVDEGTKSFNVDVVEAEDEHRFTFFIPVPGLKLDHQQIDWEARLASPDAVEFTEASEIIDLLEVLPCCTTDKVGKDQGDPLNIVLIGHPDDVYYAFLRAGWDETETIHRASLWKTAASFLTGGEYRYSPISSLYVFGRPQDVAFQKARDNIHERNHLRLWMTDARWEGLPVWIGQISRDIGVRFTRRTITTHKIDPDVDETREFLLEDLAYAQALARFAYVGGTGAASVDSPRRNLTGDPYFTDGYRVVLWVASDPVAIDDIQVVDWREPPLN
jgi:hypothetical protein